MSGLDAFPPRAIKNHALAEKYALVSPPDNGDYSECMAAIKKVAVMNGDI